VSGHVVRNTAGPFVRSVTPTDGHCLYRSVSEVMTGDQNGWSRLRWATADWLKKNWQQMQPSFTVSKKKVLNAVKFGAAIHMKKFQVKEQELVAMAESQGVTLKVHCSRHGTIHEYGNGEEQKWLYFDEVREHYEAMQQVPEDLLQEEGAAAAEQQTATEVHRHGVPWTCCKCTYVNANQEAGFLECAACDSERDSDSRSGGTSEEESELESEDSEEGSDLKEAQGGPAAFNVLKDWCGSPQSLVAWTLDSAQRGWRDPRKCSWDQALQSKIELSRRLESAAGFGTEAEAVECVVVAPMLNVTTGEQDEQQVHIALAYGSTFHVSACCSQLDPGSAMIPWQETDSRGMVPCNECAGWDSGMQQQHEQLTVMLNGGRKRQVFSHQ
jgi:hypothetical protein